MTHMEQNMALVEAFGQLEQLCNQIYGGRHGVSDYIEDMVAQSGQGRARISYWSDTLKRLKEVRHKRNKLSHGEESFQHPYATEADVQFVRAFHQCILQQKDPIAQLRKAKTTPPRPRPKSESPAQKRKGGCGTAVALLLLAAAALAVVLFTVM